MMGGGGGWHFTFGEHVESSAIRERKIKDGGVLIAPDVLISGSDLVVLLSHEAARSQVGGNKSSAE